MLSHDSGDLQKSLHISSVALATREHLDKTSYILLNKMVIKDNR